MVVLVMDRWPIFFWTYRMSLVWTYSLVAKKCLNVCKWILRRFLLAVFAVMCPRAQWKLARILFLMRLGFLPKMYSLFRGCLLSISTHFSETRICRGFPFFAGFLMVMRRAVESTSHHFKRAASTVLAPVSFNNCKNAPVFQPLPAISWSSKLSFGINGKLCLILYLGSSTSERPIFFLLLIAIN